MSAVRYEEVSIPSPFKQLATTLAISLFRAIRTLKRGLQFLFAGFGRLLSPAGRTLVHGIILPLYRVAIFFHLKFQRLVYPTRSFAIFFVSNRYLFHAVLAVATVATIASNLYTRQALAQDIGQSSLLYALATDNDIEIVRETAQEHAEPTQLSYLGNTTLSAVPHIDFDYDENERPIASLSVPGAIQAPELPTTPTGAPKPPRTKTETYVVQEGDTIGSIAQNFNVNVGTILWNNNLTERQYIRPGDALKIPPISGILATIKKGDTLAKLADRYQGDAEEIRNFNNIQSDGSLAPGVELMVPGGRPPVPEQAFIAVQTHARESQPSSRSSSSSPKDPSKKPTGSTTVAKPSDANVQNQPSSKLVWPTNGHVITQYYGWKHTGVDIDGDFTSPLYAAYDGVVEKAGWNSGGYGLQILIRHPNGMVTRYAHSSKLFVKVGDAVKRGQTIAMMGSTGRSTGSHLHFEVYVNGKRTNPLAYVK